MGVLDFEVTAHGFGTFPAPPKGKLLGCDAEVDESGCATAAERVPRDAMSLGVDFFGEPSLELVGRKVQGAPSQLLEPQVNELGSWAPEGGSSAFGLWHSETKGADVVRGEGGGLRDAQEVDVGE